MSDLPPEALLEHQAFMRALARSLLFGDEHKADDVVQQAWLAALRKPPRDRSKLRSWLGTVVRNFALRARRDDARRQRREHAAPPREPAPSSAEILERENARRRVVLGVLKLEEPYRSTIVLRFLEELPPREVARRMSVPVETVRTRVRRALGKLRATLDDAHGGERRAWSLALVPFAVPRKSALAAGALAGAILMSTKTKVTIAAALVVVAGLVAWQATRPAPHRVGERRAERSVPDPRAEAGTRDGVAAGAHADEAPVEQIDPAPVDGAGSVRGRVVANGRPLAGAYVALKRDGERVDDLFGTGPDGAFRFDHTGAFTIHAAHPGFAPRSQGVEVEAGAVATIELALDAAPWVEVRVVDADTGAPVEGAEVFLLRSGGDGANKAFQQGMFEVLREGGGFPDVARRLSPYDSIIEAFQALSGDTDLYVPARFTDARGRVRLGGLLPGRLEAVVNHDAYTAALVREPAVESGATVDVALGRGGGLTVIAPRFEGRIAEGYVCELSRLSLIPMPVRQARFDADGRVTFARLQPGRYIVSLSKDGTWQAKTEVKDETDASGERVETRSLNISRSSGGGLLERNVTIDGGEDAVLDLSGVGGAVIAGRILGGAGPWLVRVYEGDTERATGGADAKGVFRFEKIPPGDYRVVATPVGGGGEVATPCTVAPGDEEVEVELRAAGGIVSGLVTGPEGRPVEGASLFLLERATPFGSFADPKSFDDLVGAVIGKAETGPDGTFRLESVPAGRFLLFCGSDRRLAQHEFALDEGESRRVDVRLAPNTLHRLTVRLTDGGGGAVDGYVVVRDARAGLLAAFVCDKDVLDPTRAPANEHTFALSEGRYLLDVYAGGRAPLRGVPVHLLADEDLALPVAAGVAVRLRLVRDGAPVADRAVQVRFRGGALLSPKTRPLEALLSQGQWRTDAAGRLVLPHVAPGRYEVLVEGAGPAEFRVRGQPVERTLRIE